MTLLPSCLPLPLRKQLKWRRLSLNLVGPIEAPVLQRNISLLYGDTGHTYESIIGPYLEGVSVVEIEEPYVRANHQIQRKFCTRLSRPSLSRLTTPVTTETQMRSLAENSNLEIDEVDVSSGRLTDLHDREIRLKTDGLSR